MRPPLTVQWFGFVVVCGLFVFYGLFVAELWAVYISLVDLIPMILGALVCAGFTCGTVLAFVCGRHDRHVDFDAPMGPPF